MGASLKRPEKPPSPLFDKPWRDVLWGNKKKDLDYVSKFKPKKAQHLRVLLHGPPDHGKSSFIDSVDSALRGRIAIRALTAVKYGGSQTKEYRSFQIQKGKPGTFYPLVFSDTLDVEKDSDKEIDLENIKLILRGHVKEGCKLVPGSTPTGPDYNETPTINDKVHVLVCVIDATTENLMDDVSVQKIRAVREEALALRIPQVAILTKIDKACPEVQGNIRNAYKSKFLKEQMEKLSVTLKIPMNCIFLVKNYSEETKTDQSTDKLILDTMRKIIDYGQDFLIDTLTAVNTE